MHPHAQRIAIARSLRRASDDLLEASERAHDLKRFQFSSQLLDLALQVLELAKEELELRKDPPSRPQCPHDASDDVPF